jgi:hypothetical protein
MVRAAAAAPGLPPADAVVGARGWLALALALTGAALTPYLLVTTPGWDGWAHYVLFLRGDAQAVMDHMVANGRPLGGWSIVQPMAWFGALNGPKLVMAGCTLAMAGFVFLALRTGRLASPEEAALAAVLTVCGPALQTLMAGAMPQYFIGGAALFAGLWLFLWADRQAGPARVVLTVLSLLLAIAAVLFGEAPLSLLPVYPALLVASRQGGELRVGAVLRRWPQLLHHGAPVAAGAIALALQFRLYPAYGAHAGAHDLLLDGPQLARNAVDYGNTLLRGFWPVLAVLAAWLALGRIAWRAWTGVGFGAGVLFLGVLPYWIAGRVPVLFDWDLRLLLFSGLGVGLIAVALLRGLRRARLREPAAASVAVVAAIAAAWPGLQWPVRQLTDDAVMQAAAAHPALRGAALVEVHDAGEVVAGPYRHYEWTAMIQQATGRADILALHADEMPHLEGWLHYFHTELRLVHGDPLARKCKVQLEVPDRSSIGIGEGWRAWLLRTRDPAAYARWLGERIPVRFSAQCR